MLLIGLDVKTKGWWSKDRKDFVRSISEEESVVALKKMLADNYAKLPELFAVKLKRIYSSPIFGWEWFEKSISPASASPWLRSSMCLWNLAVLILVFLGAGGLAVTRGIVCEKGLIGFMAVLVIEAFTSILLLIETQERYKIAIYPIFFLVVPYVRTWFSVKENLAYQSSIKLVAFVKKLCWKKIHSDRKDSRYS